ncbi:IclR family transcriptional regulator [Croceibacterium ferulae]|uniref:IclR family transcriptional regulator n=1 Tax=Croceibacterium ferulae TaxID=1854641 RepID=UPI000EB3A508|nr:IclR family transcriptional regulator [Croceibacterium ferulae]
MAKTEQAGTDQREGGGRSYSAPALEKGFDILELLADEQGGLTISEIAARLGRSISEVFRVIIVMERRLWLRKNPGNDRYSVTYRALDVAFRATPAQTLSQAAAPVMFDLAAATNQSCHLVVRAQDRGIVVHRQESPAAVGFAIRLGTSVDLAVSCSGHVLLAFAPAERRQQILIGLLGSGPALRSALKRLDTVRAQGFEMQPSARTNGVTDLSYPVFGFDGQLAAAMTIPFLAMIDGSQLTDLEQTGQALRDAAARLTAELGGPPDTAPDA